MDPLLVIDAAAAAQAVQDFICQQVEAFHREGAILGLSGGLDSAVVATLAARALGPDQVLALMLPERDTEPSSKLDARALAARLGVRYQEVDISPILARVGIYGLVPLRLLGPRRLQAFVVRWFLRRYGRALGEQPFAAILQGTAGKHTGWLDKGVAYHRVKHRLRMLILYYRAERENRLVLGCCNRSEELTGFFVKYGDSAADIAPIGGLYKTQVRQLAAYLDVPPEIIAKAPSPDLVPGVTDEGALGLSYEVLDRVLVRLERGDGLAQIADELCLTVEMVEYGAELRRRSAHMREAPPVPDLAAGSEHRSNHTPGERVGGVKP